MLSSASELRLTYCTNVHPSDDLASMEAVLRSEVAPTLHEVLGGEHPRHLLGAWWPSDVVAAFEDEARLDAHARVLDELGLVPASLNVFPAGRFHGAGVKESVYEPSWWSDERLAYTIAAARACATILARQGVERAVMSTLPLGFRGRARDRASDERAVANVFHCALALEELLERSGVEIVLAIEPEPWCVLESIDEALHWFVDEALPFAARHGNEAAMRRHVGLCLDLCHAAVVGEDPVEAVRLCARAGMRIGKIQLSSAVVARGSIARDRLLEGFEDPVYLHQTWDRSGRIGPFVDLGDELRAAEVDDETTLVSHFHVPLHWSGDDVLETTQSEVLRFLEACATDGFLDASVPLEVETYTNPRIEEELAYVVAQLRGEPR